MGRGYSGLRSREGAAPLHRGGSWKAQQGEGTQGGGPRTEPGRTRQAEVRGRAGPSPLRLKRSPGMFHQPKEAIKEEGDPVGQVLPRLVQEA